MKGEKRAVAFSLLIFVLPVLSLFTHSAQGAGQTEAVNAKDSELSFLEPQEGAILNAGTNISIKIAGPGLKEVLLVAPAFAENVKNDGSDIFAFNYPIPAGTFGEIKISALGKSISGPLGDAASGKIHAVPLHKEITLIVKPVQMKIKSLRALSNFLSLKAGESAQIIVLGTLANGSEIDITSSQYGTQYTTSSELQKRSSHSVRAQNKTEVIRVDNNGKITAFNSGEDSVIVSHKDVPAEGVDVIVE